MQRSSKQPILRPHLEDFIAYALENFKVMFWSSATPQNVEHMIEACTTSEQREKIVAVWGRDKFGLSSKQYNARVVTIKDLQKVFKDSIIRKAGTREWDISNTILLDDSVIKASQQPCNHVCVPDFTKSDGKSRKEDTALLEVIGYLEELRHQEHVARFIGHNPFHVGDGWNRQA